MNKLVVIVGVLALGSFAIVESAGRADAGDPAPSTAVTWKGTTTAVLLTDAGAPALNAACVAEFPETRMCLASEVLTSVPAPVPGRGGYVLADAVTPVLFGNGIVLMSNLGLGFATNCAETLGLWKTKKAGSLMYLEADGNLRTGTCKDVYDAGGLGVACCGY